eukprot:6346767-Prymnesium_polylepis.1
MGASLLDEMFTSVYVRSAGGALGIFSQVSDATRKFYTVVISPPQNFRPPTSQPPHTYSSRVPIQRESLAWPRATATPARTRRRSPASPTVRACAATRAPVCPSCEPKYRTDTAT